MPSVTIVSDTAAARYAVAPLDSAVNDILERLKDISERAEDISDRLFAACSAAQGELEVFETYYLADGLEDQRKSVADKLLEIEIAALTSISWSISSTSARRSKTGKGAPSRDGALFILGGQLNAHQAAYLDRLPPACRRAPGRRGTLPLLRARTPRTGR